jgi:hypothetical protein
MMDFLLYFFANVSIPELVSYPLPLSPRPGRNFPLRRAVVVVES